MKRGRQYSNNELDRKTIQPFKASWQFLALDYSFRNLSCDHSNNAKKLLAEMGRGCGHANRFFWFGVSMARESRNLGYIFAGITGIPQWMVFQWPEIEISLFFWENLYSTYCINHFLTNNTPAKLSYYKVPAWFNVCNCCCFPMTWKRSNTFFVRKSVFHKSSIIWPMLPPPWSHITKFQIWYM